VRMEQLGRKHREELDGIEVATKARSEHARIMVCNRHYVKSCYTSPMSARVSKFLSLVLRHEPARIGIALDEHGWTDVAALLEACAAHGVVVTRAELEQIVATSDKQRFALSDDGQRIRANQGHSVEVDLELEPAAPPDVLY